MNRHAPPSSLPLPPEHREMYREAGRGRFPAEALPTHLRWRLVADLHRAGWADDEICALTRMTGYTCDRIRSGMGLRPNHPRTERMTA